METMRMMADGIRFAADDVEVTILSKKCSDGMSDRTYPDTVTLKMGDKILQGCGGLPPARRKMHWTTAAGG